jgi:hypothetical protein
VVFRGSERPLVIGQACRAKHDFALSIIPNAPKRAVGGGYGFEFLV